MIGLLLQQAFIVRSDFEGLPGLSRGSGEVAGEVRLDDHEFRRYQFDAIGEFARRKAPVQAGGDDAQIGCRKFDLDIFGPVARQQSDTIAADQAAGRQHRRRALDAVQQLAIADLPALIFDRRIVQLNLRAAAEQFADRGAGAGCGRAVEFASHLSSTPKALSCRCAPVDMV